MGSLCFPRFVREAQIKSLQIARVRRHTVRGKLVLDTVRSETETKFFRLQYLRAIAAICVVVYHAGWYLKSIRSYAAIDYILPDILGAFGVYLFFAISGYLMAILVTKSPPFQFLAHRVIRIYPIYWIVLALVSLINRNFIQLNPFAILLIPGGGESGYYSLGVEWTLPFELTFYLIIFFVIFFRLRRALTLIAILWAFVIVAMPHPELGQDRFPQLFFVPFSQWPLPFVLGLLVPLVMRLRLIVWAALPAGLALLLLVKATPEHGQLVLASSCYFLVAWAVAPRPPSNNNDRLKLLTRFGDWSYALYLCHVPIIKFVMSRCPIGFNPVAIFLFVILLSLSTSSILGRLDMFVYRSLKWQIDHGKERLRFALSSTFIAAMFACSTYIATVAAADHGRIRGDIDAVSRDPSGAVRIVGWANDPAAPYSELSVLFFYDGAYRGVGLTTLPRPDVARAFGLDPAFSRAGFSATISAGPLCEHRDALVVLVKTEDGRSSTFPLSESAICNAVGRIVPRPQG